MSLEEMNPLHSNEVHLMLVDHDPTSLSETQLVLSQSSFKVTSTKVQQVALTLLQEHKGRFNMLITSDQNQVMDCHSFIQSIRGIQEDLPIIVISSLEGDQGPKTLFESDCYVIRKPLIGNDVWGVWQGHLAASIDSKGKGVERDDNKKLKRSKPCEGGEEEQQVDEVSRKKGKSIAETKKKGIRPKFDPEQHKILMKALSYGPPRNTNMPICFPTMRPQQPPTIAERRRKARAPWTRSLNERIEKGRTSNNIPGYGVQQPQQFPPSRLTPMAYKARLESGYLNRMLDGTTGDKYGASASINGGLNVGEYQMPMNPNMASLNGLGSSISNGVDQNMNQVRTQPNPIVLDEFNNGAQDWMRFGSNDYDNSLLRVVYPKNQLNESIDYGQNNFSNLNPFPGEEDNIFQSTGNVLLTDSQTIAYNAAQVVEGENLNLEDVNEENALTWEDLGATPTNEVETLANEPSNHGSERDDRVENVNSDDEFAAMFSFLQNNADEVGINSVPDEANEVEGDLYFDIESFERSYGGHQI